MKSKAEIYVEHTIYLKTLGEFMLDKRLICFVDADGDCQLCENVLHPDDALALAAWLIDTFTIKEETK